MKLRAIRKIKKLKLDFKVDPAMSEKLSRFEQPIAEASTAAIERVGNDIKSRGRANIAAAGFGKRWQNALRVTRYPSRGVSVNPALWIYHNIPYADVFESGATIHGKPILWLPLPTAPKKVNGKRMTPKNYIASIGPLFKVEHPGKPPLLMAKFSGRGSGRRIAKRSTRGLRNAAAGSQSTAVPIFVGVPTVRIRKRFSLRRIFNEAAKRLAQYYASSVNTRIR